MLDQAAVDDLHDAVDQRQPRAGVVVDDQQRAAAVRDDAGHGGADEGGAVAVQLGRRLVQQEQPRPAGERPGQHQALLLPAGERLGGPVAPVREADRRQRLVHPRPDAVGRQSGVLQPEGDVVPGAGHDQLAVGVLGEHAQPVAGRPRGPAVDGELPGELGALVVADAGERAQQRGLPAIRRRR